MQSYNVDLMSRITNTERFVLDRQFVQFAQKATPPGCNIHAPSATENVEAGRLALESFYSL